jgi:MerR family transcriptional regulator, light-induced transcriptional regulator
MSMQSRRQGHLRIGELSSRVGVSPELLRAWERRYGLLEPSRSAGGFRLYSATDEARVRRMLTYLDRGLAAAEAARRATSDGAEPDDDGRTPGERLLEELGLALESFDDTRAHRLMDRALATYTEETVVGELVLPYLVELGRKWERGEVSVGQEHFASTLLRGRLLGLARGWDDGIGPRALLACLEGELHDIGLVAFGIGLSRRGWRITFLGANTPVDTIAATAEGLSPDIIVLSVSEADRLAAFASRLRSLAGAHRVAIAGAGATHAGAGEIGAELLEQGPLVAARALAG